MTVDQVSEHETPLIQIVCARHRRGAANFADTIADRVELTVKFAASSAAKWLAMLLRADEATV